MREFKENNSISNNCNNNSNIYINNNSIGKMYHSGQMKLSMELFNRVS